ncbi:carbohydrate-binding protein [Spirosoma sp. KUDC1026]|uniref:carbohydrate-binding protein n=1 Tax=Spirosoma sp. KUDC1026 TaxID=2745947 RepID=UPI00159BAA32|nr:carbohydrate-binding protein [Spirosoma sp. KUDC1026]QKZ14410.1 carbohydrate-binding protein [Spirosoma sp. KUDC1026]
MNKHLRWFLLFITLLAGTTGTAFSQSYVALPGRLEAESYKAMNGVRTENTDDTGGGLDVGWIPDKTWMDYKVNVATAGIYSFKLRIANGFSDDAELELRNASGTRLGGLVIPRTGGMQSWQTANLVASLPAGNQTLRLYAKKGVFSLNWFEVQPPKPLPGKIEAEAFDVATDVHPETTGDEGGGQNLAYIDDGDWMDYNVTVGRGGLHTVSFRVANSWGNGLIELRSASGAILAQVDVPKTGDWQQWSTISTTANLNAGNQLLRIYAKRGAFNLNWFEAVNTTVLPGRLEAEHYNTMSGIRTETTNDTGGGLDVGWIPDTGWMDYSVSVATAGIYSFKLRIANGFSDDAELELRNASGTRLGGLIIPRTGGMQSWQTANLVASLPAGTQTLRLYAKKGVFSINWFEAQAPKPLPGKIEAEAFDVATDVRPETTADTGGGKNLAYIDDGDWMDYNVTVAAAGQYTIKFRVANSWGNGLIELKSAAGTLLGQVDVPKTGDWQSWTTVTTTATLPAGNQLLRLYANRGAFNLNWFEATAGATPVTPPPAPVKTQAVITFAELPARTVGPDAYELKATSNNTETPITFTSSDPRIVTVSNASGRWKATALAAGTATITASQVASTSFVAAQSVSRSQVVQAAPTTPTTTKITLDTKRWYQLTNATYGLDALFDGATQTRINTGWGKVVNEYDAYYPLLDNEQMTIDRIKLYDFEGTTVDKPVVLSVITDQWQRIPIATFTGQEYGTWVGPYPDRNLDGDAKFKLDVPVSNIRYLVLHIQGELPTEIELYGTYTTMSSAQSVLATKPVKLRDMFGVNAYEWNFEDGNTPWEINEAKMNVAKSFTGIRHYMDWQKLESAEGVYSYNPTMSGGWNYDAIYERCKQANIDVLACLKTLPDWLVNTYPEGERDAENVPVRYGKDLAQPGSYIEQAKVAFQYAARYGSNPNVDPALLRVHNSPRWYGDTPNSVKIGLNLIKYIECDNERDKWWKGRKAYQNAREYAANLSAFYDGHKNTMGPGVGVKNADPTMKVVMMGLVTGPDFVRGMVDWCKEFRGYKPDGTVNLCWDVINFHLYTDNGSMTQSGGANTRGAAPEVTTANKILEEFVRVSHQQSYDMPVWITEAGYDTHQESPLRAIPIGQKSALETQADWILRSSLFSARLGIDKVFFYQMYDDNASGGMFATSGLANSDQSRRPAADFLLQTGKLFGEYVYKETTHTDPIVDRYELNGKSMYMLVVPDEKGRTAKYSLDLNGATSAKIYRPKAGAADMDWEEVQAAGGLLTVTVTETPLFVVPNATAGARVIASELPTTLEKAVQVFPNPTVDYLTVTVTSDNVADLDVTVFDASLGRLHKQVKLKKESTVISEKIDLSALPVGTYVVELKQGQERAFRKVLKTR